ncbi:MAG: hypothetical protein ABJE95_24235 [Byssovorax sp.]
MATYTAVTALVCALPSLRDVPGVVPFNSELLAHVVRAELAASQQPIEDEHTPIEPHEAKRAVAAEQFAAAVLAISFLPSSCRGPETYLMGLGTPELWSLLRDEDRVAFAQWLGSTEIWTAEEHAEAIAELAECVKVNLEDDLSRIDPRRPKPS